MRWSRPASPSPPARPADACSPRSQRLEGRQGPARDRRRGATAASPSSTMRTSPRRWRPRSTRCARSRPASSICVFGCGGDRDKGKRPIMGRIAVEQGRRRHRHRRQPAQRGAGGDPRRDPGRRAGRARDRRPRRGDRAPAVAMLGPGDVVLVAGKGHETGQIVGDKVLPFSDHEAVARGARAEADDMADAAVDIGTSWSRAAGGTRRRHAGARRSPASPSTRARSRRARCSSRSKDQRDGHEFVASGVQGRRRGGARRRRTMRASPATARCCASTIRCAALEAHRPRGARAARARGARHRRHRQRRQDRHQGDAARLPVAARARRTRRRSRSTTTGACR